MMDAVGEHFRPRELERLREQTFLKQIEFHPELPSTNDRALQLASTGTLPLLVLAERQTAGRGRGKNAWWSDFGALTFSLVLKHPCAPECGRGQPAVHWPQVSLAVGLAVCELLEDLLPEAEVGLKWPNDVYLRGKKVCGILVEVPSGHPELLVAGVGLNVNNSLRSAAPELQASATSLWDVTGREQHLTDMLLRMLRRLADRLRELSAGNLDLPAQWEPRCLLRGRRVCVTAGEQRTVGLCRGIDADGALLVETESAVHRCLSGVVTDIP